MHLECDEFISLDVAIAHFLGTFKDALLVAAAACGRWFAHFYRRGDRIDIDKCRSCVAAELWLNNIIVCRINYIDNFRIAKHSVHSTEL